MTHLPRLDRFYRDFLRSEDSAEYIAQTCQCYTIGTLQRLAEYGQRVTRRAATLALGFASDFSSNHVLGRRLLDSDRAVRLIAENALHQIWLRDGDQAQRMELNVVARLLHSGEYQEAFDRSSVMIEQSPEIAESWNQRGVAAYGLEKITKSAADYHQALELNPYHFPAAIGMAHCYLEMNDAANALSCFQRALRLHPGLDAVRVQAEFLQRSLEEK